MTWTSEDGLGVPCPNCGAAPWELCKVLGRTPSRPAGTHTVRLDLLARLAAATAPEAPGSTETADSSQVAPTPTYSPAAVWRPTAGPPTEPWRLRRIGYERPALPDD